MHVYSKIFQKNLGSWSGCFRRRQEPWGSVRCNPICCRQQDFLQRGDCCCQDKIPHPSVVNIEPTSVHCCHSWQPFFCSWNDLCVPGVQEDQSEVLTNFIQPIFLPWEEKEGRFLMCSPSVVQVLSWTGAWKLLCHVWFRKNFIGKPCQPQELPCLWMLSECDYSTKSFTKHHCFRGRGSERCSPGATERDLKFQKKPEDRSNWITIAEYSIFIHRYFLLL